MRITKLLILSPFFLLSSCELAQHYYEGERKEKLETAEVYFWASESEGSRYPWAIVGINGEEKYDPIIKRLYFLPGSYNLEVGHPGRDIRKEYGNFHFSIELKSGMTYTFAPVHQNMSYKDNNSEMCVYEEHQDDSKNTFFNESRSPSNEAKLLICTKLGK